MSVDNFLVRQKRRVVEKFHGRGAWDGLTAEDRADLTANASGLPTSYEDDELEAKQFDLLLLGAMLRLIQGDGSFPQYVVRIKKVASDLEDLANIPMVKQQLHLIAEIQTDGFWQDVTPEDLELVRTSLRLLVKLIETTERKIVYTDFTDEIGTATIVPIDAVSPGIDKARFTMKVRRFLEKHKDHIALQKLKRAEQLTATDLSELGKMFHAESVALAEGQDEISHAGGLGLFLRALTGLDRKAAKQAFSSFVEGRSLTTTQMDFLDLIINHLTEKGTIEPSRFYESPYTDLSDQGISGIFTSEDVQKIVAKVNEIRLAAVA